MKYKLMAVDVDGTLLDSNSNLTNETIDAVRQGIEKGLIFTISSGRPLQGVVPLIEKLGIENDLPVITYNGAMLITVKEKKIIFEANLDAEDAKNIIQLGLDYKTSVMVWSKNQLYANELNDRAYKYSGITSVEPKLLEDIDRLAEQGITKVLWYDKVETINHYLDLVGEHLSENVNFHTSQPYFLEFVDKKASKAKAMEKLGQYYNIKQDEMIAIGDGLNDLSMIKYAGLGVAMENAHETVKESADFISLSNDENGVAHVINRCILGK